MSSLRDLIHNHFDIDASRLTLAGWMIGFASAVAGLFLAVAAYSAVVGRVAVHEAPALAFGVAMIGGTVLLFVALRAILTSFGVPIVKDRDCG